MALRRKSKLLVEPLAPSKPALPAAPKPRSGPSFEERAADLRTRLEAAADYEARKKGLKVEKPEAPPKPKQEPKLVKTPEALESAAGEVRESVESRRAGLAQARQMLKDHEANFLKEFGEKRMTPAQYQEAVKRQETYTSLVDDEEKAIERELETAGKAEEKAAAAKELGRTADDFLPDIAETVGGALEGAKDIPVLGQVLKGLEFIGSGLGGAAAIAEDAIAGAVLKAKFGDRFSDEQLEDALRDPKTGSRLGQARAQTEQDFLEKGQDGLPTFEKAVSIGAGYAPGRVAEKVYDYSGSRTAALLAGISAGLLTDPLSYTGKPSLMGLPAATVKGAKNTVNAARLGARGAGAMWRGGAGATRAVGLNKVADVFDTATKGAGKLADAVNPEKLTRGLDKAADFLEPKRSAVLKSGRLDTGKNKVASRAMTDVGFAKEQARIADRALNQGSRARAAANIAQDAESIIENGPVSTRGIPGSGTAVDMEKIAINPKEVDSVRRGLKAWGESADESLTVEDALIAEGVTAKVIGRVSAAVIDGQQAANAELRLVAATDPARFRNYVNTVVNAVDPSNAEQTMRSVDALLEVAHDSKWASPYLAATRAGRVQAGQTVLPTAVWKNAILPMMGKVDGVKGLGAMGRWLKQSFISDAARDPTTLAWHAAQTAASVDWNFALNRYAARSTERLAEVLTQKRVERSGNTFKVIDLKTGATMREFDIRARAVEFAKKNSLVEAGREEPVYLAARKYIENHADFDSYAKTLKLTPTEKQVAQSMASNMADDWDYLLNLTQGMGVQISEFADDVIEGYYARMWSPEMRGRMLTDPRLREYIRDANASRASKMDGKAVAKGGQFGKRVARDVEADQLEADLRAKFGISDPNFKIFETNPERLMQGGFGKAGRAITAQRRLRSGVEQFGMKPDAKTTASVTAAVQARITEIRTAVAEKIAKVSGALDTFADTTKAKVEAALTAEEATRKARRTAVEKRRFWRNASREAAANYRKQATDANRAAWREAKEKQAFWDKASARMGPREKGIAGKQKVRTEREAGEAVRDIERAAGEEAESTARMAGDAGARIEREAGDAAVAAEKQKGRVILGATKAANKAEKVATKAAGSLDDGGKLLKAAKKGKKDAATARMEFDDEAALIAANADPERLTAKGRIAVVQAAAKRAGIDMNGESALDLLVKGNAAPPRDWSELARLAATRMDIADADFLLQSERLFEDASKWPKAIRTMAKLYTEVVQSARKSVLARLPSLGKDVTANAGYAVSVGTDAKFLRKAAATAQDIGSAEHQRLTTLGVITDASTADIRLGDKLAQGVENPSVMGKFGESIRERGILGTVVKGVGKVAKLPARMLGKKAAKAVEAPFETASKGVAKATDAALAARQIQDNVWRVAHYYTMKAQGMSDQAAAFMVKRDWGNFSEYTKFEANTLQKWFFFYAWKARALQATGMSFMYRPMMARAMLALAAGNAKAESDAPEWMRTGFANGIDKDGYERTLKIGFASYYDPLASIPSVETVEYMMGKGRWADRERTGPDIIGAAGRDIARMVAPPIKSGIELVADRDLYSHQDIVYDADEATAMRSDFAPPSFRYLPEFVQDAIGFEAIPAPDGGIMRYRMEPAWRTLLSGVLPGVSATASDIGNVTDEGATVGSAISDTLGITQEKAYKRTEMAIEKRRVGQLMRKLLLEIEGMDGRPLKVVPVPGEPVVKLNDRSVLGLEIIEEAKRRAELKNTDPKVEERELLMERGHRDIIERMDFMKRLSLAAKTLREFEKEGAKAPQVDDPTKRQDKLAVLGETLRTKTPVEKRAASDAKKAEKYKEDQEVIKRLQGAGAGAGR